MGIRMLHRRTHEARGSTPARADAASAQVTAVSPVPALAADASTARIPADLATTLRRARTALRGTAAGLMAGFRPAEPDGTPAWRLGTDLVRGYLALLLTLVPRPRPRPRLTVFVAPLTGRPAAPGRSPRPPRTPGDRPGPGPDATP
ncbi:hypothetical protein ACFW1F_05500 [Streptomyces bungoensis]|uniref:hypothetical protein n=1 Tax=Streptomyces bungoensis TaxID=285568 RepID=UPI0034468400